MILYMYKLKGQVERDSKGKERKEYHAELFR
jgi:hypothetical protein